MFLEKGSNGNSTSKKLHSKDPLYLFAKKLKKINESKKSKHQESVHKETTKDAKPKSVENEAIDNGLELLYPELKKSGVFKTSCRLLDDILVDLPFIFGTSFDRGVLNLPTLKYSSARREIKPYKIILFNNNNPMIKVRYDRKSISSPKNNSISEIYGLLVSTIPKPPCITSFENYLESKQLYNIRITIKTRYRLEHTKKHVAVTHYFKLADFDSLHAYDKCDFPRFNKEDKSMIDYSIYISDDTNKIILIEIFEPSFKPEEIEYMISKENILNRTLHDIEEEDDLIEKQLDILEILVYCFSESLQVPPNSETLKDKKPLCLSDDINIKEYVDLSWLEKNFDINITPTKKKNLINLKVEDSMKISYDSTDRADVDKFDKLTMMTMELMYLGKVLPHFHSNKEEIKEYMEDLVFHKIHISHSTSFWIQILGEYQSIFTSDNSTLLNLDPNYLNLCITNNFAEKDIIENYEIQLSLDPQNSHAYYESLKYISKAHPKYMILENYCKENIVISRQDQIRALELFNFTSEQFANDIDEEDIWYSYISLEHHENSNHPYNEEIRRAFYSLAVLKKSAILKFISRHEPYSNKLLPYLYFGIDPTADTENIILSYSVNIREDHAKKLEYDRSLLTIAIERYDISLFYLLKRHCAKYSSCLQDIFISKDEALKIFNIPQETDDIDIIKQFIIYSEDKKNMNPIKFISLTIALNKLATSKNSKLLTYYYEKGKINPKLIDSDSWPAGIYNIGNTCYLNSLFQYYFSISPFREYILNYQLNESDFNDANEDLQIRRIGGREVQQSEIKRSIQFVYRVQDLFKTLSLQKSRRITPSNEIAYLAFTPNDVEIEFKKASEAEFIAETHALETGMSNLSTGTSVSQTEVKIPHFYENAITQTSESRLIAVISHDDLEATLEMGNQQDVTECINNVLYQIETASMPSYLHRDREQNDLVKELFYGETEQIIKPLDKNKKVHTKRERFLAILVNVIDNPNDIYDALDKYFLDEYLNMDEYGEVKKSLSITNFPTILNIQIQRVYYDKEKFMPYKCNTPIPFTNEIFLDRYTYEIKNDNLFMIRRKKVIEMRKQMTLLKQEKKQLIEQFSSTDDDDSIHELSSKLAGIYSKLNELEHSINNEMNEYKDIGYTLFAVFVHRGQASFGHYWIYIKDFNNEIWRKYNDQYVTEAHEDEIFNLMDGDIATPYFLVYVKSDKIPIIQPLKKDLVMPELYPTNS